MEAFRREDERLDSLDRGGLYILQKPEGFRFGTDAVLLADFAKPRPKERVIDLGAGSGVLPLLIAARVPDATFRAVEIQPEMADMARRSAVMNGLAERIKVYAMDLRNAPKLLGHGSADLVVCNPPYGKRGAGLINPNPAVALARHECDCSLEEIVGASAALLRNGGRLAMVFPAARLLELLDAYRAQHIQPKRVRLVHAHTAEAPKLALIEGVKRARPGLHWLPPLILRDDSGEETEELRRIYHEEV